MHGRTVGEKVSGTASGINGPRGGRGGGKRWAKTRASRLARRWAKQDLENAPVKRRYYGWFW